MTLRGRRSRGTRRFPVRPDMIGFAMPDSSYRLALRAAPTVLERVRCSVCGRELASIERVFTRGRRRLPVCSGCIEGALE